MGILADNAEEDVKLLSHVANASVAAWKKFRLIHPEKCGDYLHFNVEINDDLIPHLSGLGSQLIEAHFSSPGFFVDRLAILLVLANCCPLFKLSDKGKPVTSFVRRRDFFVKLTPAFVNAALYRCQSAEQGYYQFDGIPGQCHERFLAFLQLLDAAEIAVVNNSPTKLKKAEEAAKLKVLARDVIAIANFLEPGIRFIPGAFLGDGPETSF